MSTATTAREPELARILDLLACPWCGRELVWAEAAPSCSACDAEFSERDGIVDLARRGTAETWTAAQQGASSEEYQQAYRELEAARDYNRAYEVWPLKRLSTWRERRLIGRLLGSAGRVGTLLELPCGGGRLSPSFSEWSDLLIQADVGWGQLLHAQARPALPGARVLLAASAFHVPLRDGAVDAVACIRLNHHLPTSEERHRLMAELFRVSRSQVLMTFFDHHSMKNRIRRLQRKPPKLTMTVDEVGSLAREHGFELVAAPLLSWWGSGHRYALMTR